jgi:TusA-related sulfurtransferase
MDLNSIKPTKVVDARAMACPGPLLEAKKGIAAVKVGEVLEIQSGDKGSREDIPAWCKKTGHEFLGFVERDGYDSLYVLRKK